MKLSFRAVLENWAEGMDYCAVAVPKEITLKLGTHGPVLVMAQLNGSEPFKVSLFPVGGGQHYIRVKAKVRRETQTKVGDEIELHITVLDRSEIELPEDLQRALQAAKVDYSLLPSGEQNFLIRRIEEAVKPATRAKRVQLAVEAAQQRAKKLAGKSK